MAVLLIFIILLLAAIYFPQWWAQKILRRYRVERDDFPGNGGEFARHLLNKLHLQHVQVETTDRGDHYDLFDKAVRLAPEHIESRSLTAVVVAAHEIGHALQDEIGYQPLMTRTKMAQTADKMQKLGAGMLVAIPLIMIIVKLPAAGLLLFFAGLLSMGTPVVIHLLTLPVEFDASFKRALPLLETGGYLSKHDLHIAKRILFACALTYVASSLAALLNLWRWIQILRR